MGARKKKVAPRPRSGFVTEEQRHTERLTLRLKPEVMQLLRSLASEIGEGTKAETYARTIEEALLALDREMTAESEHNERVMAEKENEQ
jgi:hypothetical protein